MEQFVVRVTTVLCIAISILLLPCATSLQIDAQVLGVPSLTSLPRKLKLMQQEIKAGKGIDQSQMRAKDETAGGMHHNEATNTIPKREERMGEWEDPTDLFTMDYRKVRRRRPIHNKSLPVGP